MGQALGRLQRREGYLLRFVEEILDGRSEGSGDGQGHSDAGIYMSAFIAGHDALGCSELLGQLRLRQTLGVSCCLEPLFSGHCYIIAHKTSDVYRVPANKPFSALFGLW